MGLDRVAIVGVGCTKFGELHDKSYEDLGAEAINEALSDARVDKAEIQAAWLGTCMPGFGAGLSGGVLADVMKLYGIPITRVENFCATGMDAFRNACFAVAAGVYDIVLAVGIEKLKDTHGRGLPRVAWHPVIGKGYTAPGNFALAATRYMQKYGIDRRPLARVAVKNHENGYLNPKSHLRMRITEEQVLKAPMVAYPFGVFDCCPLTDGAAAAIITTLDIAKAVAKDKFVKILGLGLAVTSLRPQMKPDFDWIGFQATVLAAKQAYKMAIIDNPRRQISFAEVHDCFTWTEITNYEDLGFCEKGEGWKLIEDGVTRLDGKLPVNPSGGLKSFGHPVGASGLRMIYEVVKQLRGECSERQVKSPSIGLAHNLGGPGAVGFVAIFKR